jgi:4-hydroxybenzoate polyprenyltransferase
VGRGDISGIPKTGQEGRVLEFNVQTRTIKLLARALSFLLSNSVFLALNGALVVVFAGFLYDCSLLISFELFLAAFLVTFSVYCLNNATDTKEDAINRPDCGSKRSVYYVAASAVAMMVSIVIGLANGWLTLFVIILPLIIGFVYSVPVARSVPRLKEIVGVKSLVVAFSWAVTGALLPLTIQSIEWYKVALVFLYIFISIFVNTVIFDALDVRGDLVSGVKTIPIVLGAKGCRVLLLIVNSSLVVWLVYCFMNGLFGNLLFALTFGVGYEYFIIFHFLRAGVKRLHAELTVDGVWLPIVVLMKLIVR